MSQKENKVNITFWDNAVQAYQASKDSLPAFCNKYKIKQDEFERWLKLFAYTSKDSEDKRIMKETRWQFQPVRIKDDASSPTGLAFNGRDTICEVMFKNGRRLFFDSSISECALHKLISVLELRK
jgi:hypothetical protein